MVSFLADLTGYWALGADCCGAALEPKPWKASAIPEKKPLKALDFSGLRALP